MRAIAGRPIKRASVQLQDFPDSKIYCPFRCDRGGDRCLRAVQVAGQKESCSDAAGQERP
jgi:hypothetical protein